MAAGENIRPGVPGGEGGKKPVMRYSDTVYRLLRHLSHVTDGNQITGITDTVFGYLDREWTVETATHLADIRLFSMTRYENRKILRSDLAWKLLTAWERKAVDSGDTFAFDELVKELLGRSRTTRPWRRPQKGDFERILAVRATLDENSKQALALMTPSEQKRFYESHAAFSGEIVEQENRRAGL